MYKKKITNFFMLLNIGIFLLLLLYILSGYQKIINFNKSVNHLKIKSTTKTNR